jgi:hypothetical protein
MAKKVNKNNNMVKVLIKEKSFDELIGVVNSHFNYNRMVNFVGGPFKYNEKGQVFYCQKITFLGG